MAKFSQQLCQSLSIYIGVTATILLPWSTVNESLADDGHVAVVQNGIASGFGMYLEGDPSCEPTFRGGDCHNCCLDLWQGYCETRTCGHCSQLGCLGGLYSLKSRLLGCGYCSSGNCAGSCSSGCSQCSAGSVHAHGAGCGYESGNTDGSVTPDAVEPPANPLPPSDVPPSPSASTRDARPMAVQPTPPAPPQIDFSSEPPSPGGSLVKTVSGSSNPGTIRLLEQLRSN